MKKVILASASKRRSDILDSCGIEHIIVISDIEEKTGKGKNVSDTVLTNAARKTEKVSREAEKAVVIGADTLVVHGEEVLGKPQDENAARRMLSKFSGTEVEVYTGLCVIDTDTGKKAKGFEKSSLEVVPLSGEQVERYFRLLGPYDKAGGFTIEGIGSLIFDNIKGSFYNILGLPMIKLKEMFKELGLDILDFVKT
ncbi:MAG: septum formation protein Maf [Candidatus Omnitrophica bacterium]|nr:septum formation protein Maf [Candidatus Omnitrophota bacterium]